jgi:general secretion pathway protein F
MIFSYTATNHLAEKSQGEVEAINQADAIVILKKKGLIPTHLQQKKATTQVMSQKGFSRAQMAIFVRELAILLKAGVPLAEAISSMRRTHVVSEAGQVAERINNKLISGSSLTEAMQQAEVDWPLYLLQLASAGEMTGQLAKALAHGADQMDYQEKIAGEIKSALIYPAVLLSSGILATLTIFIVVVPKFANLLKNDRVRLPDISVWVLKSGLFVKQNMPIVGILALTAVLTIGYLLSNKNFKKALPNFAERLPFIGAWIRQTEIARWASMLQVLLENKVPLIAALELAKAGVGLKKFQDDLSVVISDIRAGISLSSALEKHDTVTPMAINLISVGERSGDLPATLKTISELYISAGRDRMKRFLILLEPLTILLMGSVIGFIMVAIMLAITSLSNVNL